MNWLEKFLLPPSCQLCGATAFDDELCLSCAQSAQAIVSACPLCALPNHDGSVCSPCNQNPPPWQQAHSCLIYQGSTQKLLVKWKYQQRSSTARLLMETLKEWIELQQLTTEATAIIPIPMHTKKLRARGFNTAYTIASAMSDVFQLPILERALIRHQQNSAQASLSKTERQHNLAHSFSVIPEHLHGHQRIILVDDVYTTGATLTVCTQQLQAAGIIHTHIMTLARTPPPSAF